MRIIKGNLDYLLNKEEFSLENNDDYISAIITDEDYVMDAIGKLRKIYKNILRLEYQNKRNVVTTEKIMENIDITNKSELDLFMEFYDKQNNIKLDAKRINIIKNVIKDIVEDN